jgi:predicted transcriptional regulator
MKRLIGSDWDKEMSDAPTSRELPTLTTQIVAAYVSNNPVPVGELPGLIRQVHTALVNVGAPAEVSAERPQPAVPIKRSVTPDYIICLEDGKKLKMLKRHLKTAFNMSPEEYRERWDLPADYPMVAPNYATQRSRLAKQIGLGTRARRRAPAR